MGKKNAIRMVRNAAWGVRPEEGMFPLSSGGGIRHGNPSHTLIMGTTGAGKSDMALLRALACTAAIPAPPEGNVQE